MPFSFKSLSLPEALLIETRLFRDDRGFFMETYKHSEFVAAGIREHFVQDNRSRSAKSVLRGLHYQKKPKAQGKLVRCLEGSIYDVAVDIRKGSPDYGRWAGAELSAGNNLMLYIPPGFAHGFVVLSDAAEILYKCTEEYSPENDRGIIWNDPEVNIAWPVKDPLLSPKDGCLPLLGDADNNFLYGQG